VEAHQMRLAKTILAAVVLDWKRGSKENANSRTPSGKVHVLRTSPDSHLIQNQNGRRVSVKDAANDI